VAEPVTLRTERLVLRPWRDTDLAPFAALNADPEVMEHFPSTLTRQQSDAAVERFRQRMEAQGWGLWAVEVPGVVDFAGFVGLNPGDDALGRRCIEVGWRLAKAWWGRGYAPEGAVEAVRFAFDDLELVEIVSFTVPANLRSRRVMEKIGLRFAGEFDHARLVRERHPLSRHVLYRAERDHWPVSVTHE
jgi:3-dehydroquinate dehydratase/shikimate dehydrogenase